MPVTINDVAQTAGVSISTVSYALSGKRSIGEKTRRRIEQAIKELGYSPNAGARALAGRRTYILAVTEPLRPDTYTQAHMAFVLATAKAARSYDYDVLLLTQEEATNGLQRVAASQIVDGVIVLDVLADDERVPLVRDLGIPAAFVGIPNDRAGLWCVDLDFEAAAELAVDRLADLGHRRIGLLGQPPTTYERGSNFPLRLREAFFRRANERGIDARFAMPEVSEAGVRVAMESLFGPDRDLTGLVMHAEDSVQSDALNVLDEWRLGIPEDVSVIAAAASFDTAALRQTLDVIPLEPEQSCSRAVAQVLAQLDGEGEPGVELLPPTYIDRSSTTVSPQ